MIRTLLLFCTGFAAVAQSQHVSPFTGTWRLNLAKSKFDPGPPFRSFTLTFGSDGRRNLDLVYADGRKLQASLPWSGGQELAVNAGRGFENVTAVSKIRGNTFDDTWKQSGRIIENVRGEVSRDGRTLTIRVEGTDAQDRRFRNRLQFDKASPDNAVEIRTEKEATSVLMHEDVRTVSPALERYMRGPLNDLWKRPGLSARDRSIVTVAALIARNQASALPMYLDLALDNGVKPGEISEIITHLAFYSGLPNALTAIGPAKDAFRKRGVQPDQLPAASGDLLPMDEAAEAQRATRVQHDFGAVAPGVLEYTTKVLFLDVWRRPALAPRDRSLVTVSALVASGQVAQVAYHLNRAMDNGLTKAEASEVLTQLAFYAGWPNVFSAMPVVKGVFEARPK